MSLKTPMTTIDDYLDPLDADKRAALERLRAIIRSVVPDAEECISYGLPTFRLDGKNLIHIGASSKHCAIYGAVGPTLAKALAAYDTSRGTIRFQPEKPLPVALVRKLVKERVGRIRTAEAVRQRRSPRRKTAAGGRSKT